GLPHLPALQPPRPRPALHRHGNAGQGPATSRSPVIALSPCHLVSSAEQPILTKEDLRTMPLLVTGSIGIDTVETPFGKRDDVIGGSAVYFAYSASFFTPVRLVGVVGDDAPEKLFSVFPGRQTDTAGL